MGLDIYFTKKRVKEIGYFRKVNFLVRFFENKGFDVENQRPLEIVKKDVLDLIDACKKVLNDHSLSKELLPTMRGFFFGNTDYDKSYFENVQYVLDYCNDELLPEFDNLNEDESIYFETWY